MEIKNGGKTESLVKKDKTKNYINSITVRHQDVDRRTIDLRINDNSVSYLTLEEALDLRDELNTAIKYATKLCY